MTHSDSSFRVNASDKEGMVPKGIGLLFFAFLLIATAAAEDYPIQKGDSAAVVAQKNKVPADVLQRANPDFDWTKAKPGDTLFLPDRYLVKPGDTLYSLCRSWGVDQSAVLALNNLSGPTALRSGQVLFIPPAKAVLKSAAAPGAYWPVDKTPKAEGDKLKSVTFATSGEPFRSVSAGTVVFQGEFRGVGRVLMIQRDDKAVFAYGNFEGSTVEFGQTVAKGQVLGTTSPRPSQRLSFFAFRQTDSLDVFTLKR
jgi:LysM repeat protein